MQHMPMKRANDDHGAGANPCLLYTSRAKGRNTFIFIDEIYLLFQHEYSANFLFTLPHRRLQVLYGADYGLTYSSDVGKGTEVQIRIPAKRDETSGETPKPL